MLSLASVKYYVNYKDKAPYGFEKSVRYINGKKYIYTKIKRFLWELLYIYDKRTV
ncbi:MAG: hypothetical protein ACLT2Z_09670 [Eubacterium sp.]